MSFDQDTLAAAVARHGRVVRVVIAEARGSAPRDPGAAMLVWTDGQSGTIGGGALEFDAARTARQILADGPATRVTRAALGPALNQCCGGAVTVVSEAYDAPTLAALPGDGPVARRVDGTAEMPLALRHALRSARGQGTVPDTRLLDGWLIEPRTRATRPVWIFGAGHVGRALVDVLAPVPEIAITWIDTGPERFPDAPSPGVTLLPAADPARVVPHAPDAAEHLILTYSHTLDLAICHSLLGHGFRSAGLIGSATKWARFRTRLGQLGHSQAEVARIACPIGDPTLGKHPQAIAVGVAAALLSARHAASDAEHGRKERGGTG